MKMLKAVRPYIYPNQMNFKDKPFEAWREIGGGITRGWYPRALHKVMFSHDLPTLWQGEARLCFVQPVSLYFDTFFTALNHEIIPFFWDCWPMYFDLTEKWLKKHKVRTAIFTSRQEMEEMKMRLPEINYLWCPEAINVEEYNEGKSLNERSIDLLEFGRSNEKILGPNPLAEEGEKERVHVTTKVGNKFLYTEDQLHGLMEDAKVTICLPRSMTQPEIAGNIETLTQRYWEAMLSRMVIVGHCPMELEENCGYNPVVEASLQPSPEGKGAAVQEQILDILNNIEDYQELVDRNRQTALEKGDWKVRMKMVREWLQNLGYDV